MKKRIRREKIAMENLLKQKNTKKLKDDKSNEKENKKATKSSTRRNNKTSNTTKKTTKNKATISKKKKEE